VSDAPSPFRISVLGATGYGGAQIIANLASHPGMEVVYAGSNTYAGQPLAEACPWLRGLTNLACEEQDPERAADGADLVVMAAPKGFAMKWAPMVLGRGVRVIDLSGDFRFRSPAVYEAWYGGTHAAPELCAEAVYGLPELWAYAVANARLVANPGCYPTGAILALYPLLADRLIDPATIIVDAKSGVSGAGRAKHQLGYHFPEMNENLMAYRVGDHQHTPEIEQALARAAGTEVRITFTPQLVPVTRGILETMYATPSAGVTAATCREALRRAYEHRPYVRVLPEGASPATKATLGSNFCDVNVFDDKRTGRIVAIAAFDNIGRGQAHMAVQNMNLMLGLPESLGVPSAPTFP
jgi:N-acetyl-gamma-glutamyl-phosphate reductase